MTLPVGELAGLIDQMRGRVIASKHRAFPGLAVEDLEDAYSRAVEGIFKNEVGFEGEAQLASYLHRAVGNLAVGVIQSAAYRTSTTLDQEGERSDAIAEGAQDPDQGLLTEHARALLVEFLAELSDEDRRIAYLHLDPAHALGAREIARELNLAYPVVRQSLKRSTIALGRFAALLARPGAFCHRRRRDVLSWQVTGVVPLALRVHLAHCRSCRAQHHAATQHAAGALLPLIPAAGVALVGRGALVRVYHAVLVHPVTVRAHEAFGRWRKVAAGTGGGGAAVAAKLAVVGAVVSATAALHVISHGPAGHLHHRHGRRVHLVGRVAQRPSTVTRASTVMAPAIVAAQTASSRTESTTSSATTSAIPPSPEADPLRARTGSPEATVARSGETKRSGTSRSSSTAVTAAYAPAPDQTTTTTTSVGRMGSGQMSSGLPAPGAGPPPP